MEGKMIINYCKYMYRMMSRGSSVDIAIGYGLDDRGSRVRFRRVLRIFLFSTASRPAMGPTQPPFQWVPGALSPEIKRSVREPDHSPPYSAELRMRGAIHPSQ
jgi:hypothetical protein